MQRRRIVQKDGGASSNMGAYPHLRRPCSSFRILIFFSKFLRFSAEQLKSLITQPCIIMNFDVFHSSTLLYVII